MCAVLTLSAVVARSPHRVALLGDGLTLSFAELYERVEIVAAELQLGVRATGPIAFVAKNDAMTVALVHALLERRIGVLPLHPRLTRIEQSRLIQLAGARFVQVSESSVHELADPFGPTSTQQPPSVAVKAQLLIATSGSSGSAKLVRLSRAALEAAALSSVAHLAMNPGDRWLLSLGLAHIGGFMILLRCLAAEAAVVLGEPGATASELAGVLERQCVSLASFVPTQLERLMAHPIDSVRLRLRAILVGGARTPGSLLRRARARGLPVLLTYGLSEACAQITTQPLSDLLLESASEDAGVVLPGAEVKIEENAICIRGPQLFDGYLPDLGPTLDSDGWFKTSDLGYFDKAARLVPLGRSDDWVVTGGEKVSTLEVEAAILDQPLVQSASVVALPSEQWGQIVAAAVVVDPSADWTLFLEAIQHRLSERLATFKRPKRWLRLDELPCLPTGKVDRVALRARFDG